MAYGLKYKMLSVLGAGAALSMTPVAANAQEAQAQEQGQNQAQAAEAAANAAAAAAAEAAANAASAAESTSISQGGAGGSAAAASESHGGAATINQRRNRFMSASLGAGFYVSPNDLVALQNYTGNMFCKNGVVRFVTQGDAAFGKNSSEALFAKVELTDREKRERKAAIKAARQAGDKDRVAELKDTPVIECSDTMVTPGEPQPAPAPVQPSAAPQVTNNYNYTINEAAPAPAAPKARVTVRHRPTAPRRPVRRAQCACQPAAPVPGKAK